MTKYLNKWSGALLLLGIMGILYVVYRDYDFQEGYGGSSRSGGRGMRSNSGQRRSMQFAGASPHNRPHGDRPYNRPHGDRPYNRPYNRRWWNSWYEPSGSGYYYYDDIAPEVYVYPTYQIAEPTKPPRSFYSDFVNFVRWIFGYPPL